MLYLSMFADKESHRRTGLPTIRIKAFSRQMPDAGPDMAVLKYRMATM